jgi:antitoxin ChpS
MLAVSSAASNRRDRRKAIAPTPPIVGHDRCDELHSGCFSQFRRDQIELLQMESVMPFKRKIRKQGNSAILSIPSALLRRLNVGPDDLLTLDVQNGVLIGRPVNRPIRRYTLAELLVGADQLAQLNASVQEHMDWPPVGREL